MDKEVKQKLSEYLTQVIDTGSKYKEGLTKQIEATKQEVTKMEEAFKDLDTKISELKQMLEFVKKVK